MGEVVSGQSLYRAQPTASTWLAGEKVVLLTTRPNRTRTCAHDSGVGFRGRVLTTCGNVKFRWSFGGEWGGALISDRRCDIRW